MFGKKGYGLFLKTAVTLFFLVGCARVSIESKQPIKLDVTMRLDVYQHVANDADAIEGMVSGSSKKDETGNVKMSFLDVGVAVAWAEDTSSYSPEVKAAIEQRRDRKEALNLWESKGVVGENINGLVEIKNSALANDTVTSLVGEENTDRGIIYRYVAHKNNVETSETAAIFAKKIQADALPGTPIETQGGWKIK